MDMKEREHYYDVLDAIRESGIMNMFGAPRYLMDEYGIDHTLATQIFTEWTQRFEKAS
jgi:hypothetical protein